MPTWLLPPRIIHRYGRIADDRPALCRLCGAALKMSKGELALLQFYASCQSGYTPSLQSIANKLRISRKGVQKCRNMLIKHGCIHLDCGNLYVDWHRIRLFSTLDPAMTNKHAVVAPAILRPLPSLTRFLEAVTFEDALLSFSRMSDKEYDRWRNWHRQVTSRMDEQLRKESRVKDFVDICEEEYEEQQLGVS